MVLLEAFRSSNKLLQYATRSSSEHEPVTPCGPGRGQRLGTAGAMARPSPRRQQRRTGEIVLLEAYYGKEIDSHRLSRLIYRPFIS